MIFVILCSYIYPCLHLSIHHQSLESALRHPGDNRTQIRELGQTLIDGGILDELISEKLKAFNSRYEQLNHQVRTLSLCVSKCGMHVFVTIEKGICRVKFGFLFLLMKTCDSSLTVGIYLTYLTYQSAVTS